MSTNYENVKKWRANNPGKLKEQRKKYRTKHRESIQQKWREWYRRKQEERLKDLSE